MCRRLPYCAPLCAALILLSLCGIAGGAAPAGAAEGAGENASPVFDQGSNANYRSDLTSVTPAVHGLSVQVLEFADRLLLINHTGQTVVIYGYQRDPYLRLLANGTVEQNRRSPATYLNQSFYGNIAVPALANPSAAPQWTVIDRTGSVEWHDHRIHWPSPQLPPQVKDRARRTLIFDWQVPIRVGARTGAIAGQLFWVPNSSSAPVGLIVAGIVIVLGGLLLVAFVRRRRARTPGPGAGGGQEGTRAPPPREAW